MSETYSADVEWAGINIEVRLTKNWLSGTAHHLELRADQPLSVTATGYRSHFISSAQEVDVAYVLEFVIAWLDEAAQSRDWQERVDQRRQGDLFDL